MTWMMVPLPVPAEPSPYPMHCMPVLNLVVYIPELTWGWYALSRNTHISVEVSDVNMT